VATQPHNARGFPGRTPTHFVAKPITPAGNLDKHASSIERTTKRTIDSGLTRIPSFNGSWPRPFFGIQRLWAGCGIHMVGL
jgi:hypothetical protein